MVDPRGLPSEGSVTAGTNDPVHGPTDWRSIVESESLYRSLVEQLPAAVFVDLFLPEHTKVYISPIVEPMLGYPQASYYTDHDLWERSSPSGGSGMGSRGMGGGVPGQHSLRRRIPVPARERQHGLAP